MKKQLFFALVALVIAIEAKTQNVGIGTTTPKEKLDVNGNVNVVGTILADGTRGANGQVLTSTGTGLNWASLGSLMGYKYCRMFMYTGTMNYTVPSGVTEFMVEAWGGGSGGYFTQTYNLGIKANYYAYLSMGGTSGSYARTISTVSPGQTLSIQIGHGGLGGSTSHSGSGGSTKVTFPDGEYLVAAGGGRVNARLYSDPALTSSKRIQIDPVFNGINASKNASSPTIAERSYFINGNVGKTGYELIQNFGGDDYLQSIFFGNGGAPVGMINSSETFGGYRLYLNGTVDYGYQTANHCPVPSGGGGSYYGSGVQGMVILWWN